MFKSGFVTILGRPNVGKSTLMNAILKQKISIISPTAQTTRNSIKGIYTTKESQIIFVDTPGIHKPKTDLDEYMNKQSYNSLNDCDLIMWIVDASEEFGGGDSYIINLLYKVKTPVIIVFNKMDKISDEAWFRENQNKFLESKKFSSVNYVSAIDGKGIDTLLESITDNLEEGPQYYDGEIVTDSIERFIVSELIREKIFLLTKEEVPHSVAVDVDQMKMEDDVTMHIMATIYVDRKSQKKIIIGSNGQMIKQIGTLARKDIVMLLGNKVYLELWVKVDEGWRNNKSTLNRLGYK